MNSVRIVVMLMMALFILAGCNAQPAAPTPEATPVTVPTTATEPYPAGTPETESYPGPVQEGYPGPDDAAPFEAYPSPEGDTSGALEQGTPEPLVVPTPSSATVGNVTGRILQATEGGEAQPLTEGIMYLGVVVETTEGFEGLVRLDRGADPQAMIDPQGHFVFTDVAPDRYGLWLVPAVGNPLLLKEPETGGDMILEVPAGEVLELGELSYELPETF